VCFIIEILIFFIFFFPTLQQAIKVNNRFKNIVGSCWKLLEAVGTLEDFGTFQNPKCLKKNIFLMFFAAY
jgi:hypothetical protein